VTWTGLAHRKRIQERTGQRSCKKSLDPLEKLLKMPDYVPYFASLKTTQTTANKCSKNEKWVLPLYDTEHIANLSNEQCSRGYYFPHKIMRPSDTTLPT
jgi:hypothetical protein